ncbi:MAG: hypothetical protein PHC61_12720, partial [Chitinivibrionales bacterium]|nr:hypothetical protein [Chitinivibrionales bacterium]
MIKKCLIVVGIVAVYAALFAQEAPLGSAVQPTKEEQKALDNLKGKINGKIVWSTSRVHTKHDIWIMNADGTGAKALTSSPDNVDWFPRFSPDGRTVLFVRSKMGWVPETDAETFDKWDLWTIKADGSGETKVAESACWGTWRPSGDSIVFARGPKVFIKSLKDSSEKELFDAEAVIKKSAYSQEPNLSPNGNLLALTIRGSNRQTGIYNFAQKKWNTTGGGCQID